MELVCPSRSPPILSMVSSPVSRPGGRTLRSPQRPNVLTARRSTATGPRVNRRAALLRSRLSPHLATYLASLPRTQRLTTPPFFGLSTYLLVGGASRLSTHSTSSLNAALWQGRIGRSRFWKLPDASPSSS